MHNRHAGVLTTWKQPLSEDHFAEIFIWASREELRAAHKLDDGRTYGRCECFWACYKEDAGKKTNLSGRKFGEVHFVLADIGVGYVAHELQHLVSYWCQFMQWTLENNDEDIAYFCEMVTRDFWTQFYQLYPEARERGAA